MARLSKITLVFALAAAAALGLVACGGENADLLPGGTASEINENLERVEQLVAERDCLGAEVAAVEVSEQVDALEGVDRRLKNALAEGATKLNDAVAGCEEEEASEEEAPLETIEEEPEEEEEKPGKRKGEEKKEEEAETPSESSEKEEDEGGEEGETPSEDGGTPSGGVSPSAPAGSE